MINPNRIPWGFISVGGASANHLTATTTFEDRRHRSDMGETAIKLLAGLGISLEALEALDTAAWDKEPAELAAALEKLLTGPAAAPAPLVPEVLCCVQCPNNDLFCDLEKNHPGEEHEGDLGREGRQRWVCP